MRKEINFLVETFFRQITELGSMTLTTIIILATVFIDTGLFWRLLISIVAITIISYLIKALFFMERPKKQPVGNVLEKIDASTFPSVHSARVTAIIFWAFTYLTDTYAKILLVIIGLLVLYSRIYLKKHYLSDVIGGIFISIIISLAVLFIANGMASV